jgi:hypothetical protein
LTIKDIFYSIPFFILSITVLVLTLGSVLYKMGAILGFIIIFLYIGHAVLSINQQLTRRKYEKEVFNDNSYSLIN